MPVIGFLGSFSLQNMGGGVLLDVKRGLAVTGYVEDRNVAIEYRFADDHYERLPALAAELVPRPVLSLQCDKERSYEQFERQSHRQWNFDPIKLIQTQLESNRYERQRRHARQIRAGKAACSASKNLSATAVKPAK